VDDAPRLELRRFEWPSKRNEVTELRRALALVDTEKTATARRDLLAYIRSMPQEQLGELTNDVTPDVLDGMKKLAYAITRGMDAATVEPGVVLQQSGQAMAQLCMCGSSRGHRT
ncbi:hypothetical protein CTAYLR_009204, partial [Chrysophaeum taylorii]